MSPTRTVPRVTTLGEFELHVQSVRSTRNNNIQPVQPVQPVQPALPDAPPRAVVLPLYSTTEELPQYANPNGISVSDDKDSIHSSTFDLDEKQEKPTSNNRTTSDNEEPKTVARTLFRFGFMMPLLWLIGASIIFLDLKYYPDVLTDVEDPRTDEERAADLRVIRRAELRWAWRSVYAFVTLVLVVLIVVLTYLGVTNKWTGVHS